MWMPTKLYQRILRLCRHPHAGAYFMALAFFEAFILPLSPALMQVPLTLASPQRAWTYCVLGILGSVCGGMIGYVIGDFFIQFFFPLFESLGWLDGFVTLKTWFVHYGLVVLFLASLSPTPYKITTIAAGAVGIPFAGFFFVTFAARTFHFAFIAYALSGAHARALRRFIVTRYGKKNKNR